MKEYFAGCSDPAKAYAYAVAYREKINAQRDACDKMIAAALGTCNNIGGDLDYSTVEDAMKAERDRLYPPLGPRDFPRPEP